MKNSVAILTDIYYPHPMAGGICAHQVAKGLRNLDYDVHIICLRRKGEAKEDNIEGINVHRIKMPIVYRMRDWSENISNPYLSKIIYNIAIMINRIFKIIFLKWYPLMSPLQIVSYVKCVKQLSVDAVIGEYFSVESAYAGAILKKKYGKKMIMYNVDSLSNSDPAVGLNHAYIRNKGLEWERKIFDIADGVIVMKCHELHYKGEEFNKYRHKIKIADLPLMERVESSVEGIVNFDENNKYNSREIKWLYTGSLSQNIRNPEYVLNVFRRISLPIEFHFFSKGDCENSIRRIALNSKKKIIQHGHVAKTELEKYYVEADFLISIGNLYGDFLPSKTIEYIAHLKPIIHFCYQEKDASVRYLEKYEHALIIKVMDGDFEAHIKCIEEFVEKYTYTKFVIDPNYIEQLYKENTPEFTANIIHNVFKSLSNSK